MASIRIVCIGRVKERYISEGISLFLRRLMPLAKLEIIELKDEGLPKEAEKLGKYSGRDSYVLDPAGRGLSTAEFTELIRKAEGALTFIIGGPDGILESLKKNTISLSRMTFTHEMCRLFLIEQIYRAEMVLSGRGYYNK